MTSGSGIGLIADESPEVAAISGEARDAVASRIREAAAELFRAAADGRAEDRHIDALADAVLGDELARLALRAREAGPERLRRALELAAAILARGFITPD